MIIDDEGMMVRIDEENLNRLFQEMADWNTILKLSKLAGPPDGHAR